MARRLIGTGTTDSNGKITVSYTGTGAGKLQLVAVNGNLVSETYELYDTIVHETQLTSTKSYNISLNDTDFYLEFTVHPTTESDATAYLNIGDGTNTLNIGDIYSNASCGINWTNGTFYGKAIDTDTDTKVTVTRRGTSVTLTVGESTYTVSNMDVTCNTLVNAVVANNSIKNFMIYPI